MKTEKNFINGTTFGNMSINLVKTSTGAFEVRVIAKDGSSITIREGDFSDTITIHPHSSKTEIDIYDKKDISLDVDRHFYAGGDAGVFQCVIVKPVVRVPEIHKA